MTASAPRPTCEFCCRPAMYALSPTELEPNRTDLLRAEIRDSLEALGAEPPQGILPEPERVAAMILYACGIHLDRCRAMLRDLGHAETREDILLRGLQTRKARS